MSGEKKALPELLDELKKMLRQQEEDAAKRRTRFRVNKRTHRIRFEGETEDNVEIVIEPKDEKPSV